MIIGFSTGALAKGNFKEALQMISSYPEVKAIELSALREAELPILIKEIPNLDLKQFEHISVHAPSKLTTLHEEEIIELLLEVTRYNIHIVVHPDIISNYTIWQNLGSFLCVENMDKRKPIGRTTEDLITIFNKLPEAKLCMDLAHAKQVDPSMVESVKMIRAFSHKILQFHISDVTSDSNHVPINLEAIGAFRKIESLIASLSNNIPFIVESPIVKEYISKEINFMRSIFNIQKPP